MCINNSLEQIALLTSKLLLLGLFMLACVVVAEEKSFNLQGSVTQGGMIIVEVQPGSTVRLDGQLLQVSPSGKAVFGFGRDRVEDAQLLIQQPDGKVFNQTLKIAKRQYNIERVDGLPERTVKPPNAKTLQRIRQEAAKVKAARARESSYSGFAEKFVWPAKGRLSGFYGSQRVLNGEPRRPHYGLDIAAPTGTRIYAPASGKVTLAENDLFYSGGTMIIDHGYGVSSSFLHLSKLLVQEGEWVEQGQAIAEIGATGRASGPHLDWRINWFNVRLDPDLLMNNEKPPTLKP